jgi:hypothetical protein
MILGDFHMHSRFSDGTLTIPELVDFYGQRGFGAIAITDHLCEQTSFLGRSAKWLSRTLTEATFPFYIEEIKQQAERALKQYDMIVLPGFEVTKNSILNHRSAHILAVGLDEYVSPDQDPLTIAREIRSKGGLAIAAHPVHTGSAEPQTYFLWNRRHAWADEFDAWEVASGAILFEEVLHSGLRMIASSDLHHPKQISSWKTELHCERNPKAILEAVRAQNISFYFYEDPYSAEDKSKATNHFAPFIF